MKNQIPDFVKRAPQSELSKRLYGEQKRYSHLLICSGNPYKPIGTPGCICLKALRNPKLV